MIDNKKLRIYSLLTPLLQAVYHHSIIHLSFPIHDVEATNMLKQVDFSSAFLLVHTPIHSDFLM